MQGVKAFYRINGNVRLRSFTPLAAVVDVGGPEHSTGVADDGLEAAGGHTPRLVVDRMPGEPVRTGRRRASQTSRRSCRRGPEPSGSKV